MADQIDLAALIPYPADDAHKYSRGKCVLLAGSTAYPGAACLAARASQYSGAGYTQVFTAFENKLLLRLYRPSLVVNSFEDFLPLQALKPGSKGAFVVGPGFEADNLHILSLIESVLNYAARPVLIDGGALSYLPATASLAFCLTTSSSSSFLIVIVALTFPFICTGISISSSIVLASSYVGQALYASSSLPPIF